MSSEYLPWSSLAAITTAGVLTEGWTLAACDDPETPRTFTLPVAFAAPFAHPPVVQAGLVGFDLDQRDSGRLSTRVTNITTTGFDLVFTTWEDTRVYAVEVSWLAVGP
jgi:hypothetical protein